MENGRNERNGQTQESIQISVDLITDDNCSGLRLFNVTYHDNSGDEEPKLVLGETLNMSKGLPMNLKNINVIAGTNGSGKSVFMKAKALGSLLYQSIFTNIMMKVQDSNITLDIIDKIKIDGDVRTQLDDTIKGVFGERTVVQGAFVISIKLADDDIMPLAVLYVNPDLEDSKRIIIENEQDFQNIYKIKRLTLDEIPLYQIIPPQVIYLGQDRDVRVYDMLMDHYHQLALDGNVDAMGHFLCVPGELLTRRTYEIIQAKVDRITPEGLNYLKKVFNSYDLINSDNEEFVVDVNDIGRKVMKVKKGNGALFDIYQEGSGFCNLWLMHIATLPDQYLDKSNMSIAMEIAQQKLFENLGVKDFDELLGKLGVS